MLTATKQTWTDLRLMTVVDCGEVVIDDGFAMDDPVPKEIKATFASGMLSCLFSSSRKRTDGPRRKYRLLRGSRL